MRNDVQLLKNLVLYGPVNKKIRLGNVGDGGYVIVDGYNYDCFISCGIGNNVTFENDFVQYRPNIPILAFDGTVNRPRALSTAATFIRKNVGFNTAETTDLKEYVESYSDVFIKMDIEGSEWRWIRNFSDQFVKIKQIVFEGHALFVENPPDYWALGLSGLEYSDNVLESLRVLNKTHYLVHIHENNNDLPVNINGNLYPTTMELTFIRKDCAISGLNTENLPVEGVDCVTIPSKLSHNMNIHPFVFDSKEK